PRVRPPAGQAGRLPGPGSALRDSRTGAPHGGDRAMTTLDEALDALPVIAIIRAAGSRHLTPVLETLAGNGVRAMEVTLTTPGAAGAIRWAAGTLRDVAVGAGTVLDAASARQAVDAGAGYLITPAVLPEVIEEGNRLGVPVL